ncbi:hypothetical protein EUGRSUZ_H02752 [Eucalyptus grandis]|uniref:Uncharacterized protein n=2 Tax=Eucalyptus grandis TaxID=71139 RepID=A0ACC3JSX8_EUCGR|nr:hypothetical protein EUGRSUZ_H02752 [Eucalyptus grandis]
MDGSPPIRPRPPSRGGGRGGGPGGGPPPPVQLHHNPYYPPARAWPPPTLLTRPPDHRRQPYQHAQHSVPSNAERLERIDRAVAKARRDLLATGESVSSWKVSQAVVLALQVESWDSLGFSMQQVPSLRSLMAVEGKINAFIHCFVETRKITSLYDMQIAICKNEGIERFEELELGPFLQYPLSEKRKSRKPVEIEDLLSFIAKEKSVSGTEKLGVRIWNLGCVFFVFILFN